MISPKSSYNLKTERGNIFIVVLLGIVLFAGLSFTLSRTMRSENTQRISDREIRLASTDIIEYGTRIERAVSRLRRAGCSENEISFHVEESDFMITVAGNPLDLENDNAPEDFRCHVFHPQGGNVIERFPAVDKITINARDVRANEMDPRSMRFTSTRVVGHGSDDDGPGGTELVMIAGRLSQQACADINDALGIDFSLGDEDPDNTERSIERFDNPPEDPWNCERLYTGTFEDCSDPIGDRAEILEGLTSFCVDGGANDGTERSYVHVLIAR